MRFQLLVEEISADFSHGNGRLAGLFWQPGALQALQEETERFLVNELSSRFKVYFSTI